MAEKVERLKRELKYKGHIIDMYADTVKVSNGNVAQWDFIGHKGAAAVVPVLEDGRILMVKQYRNALDRFTIELYKTAKEMSIENSKKCGYFSCF